MRVYLERRADLLRFFALRSSSADEAEDIVQEIYFKLAGIDDRDIESPVAYLYRLGSNVMLDRARARRRSALRDDAYYQTHRSGLVGGEDEQDAPSPEAAMDARRRLNAVINSVNELPPQCRRVFVMHKFEGKSYAEVASVLGISRSAVEKHMINALRRLAERKP